jgi:nicotinamide riboside kinase
MKIINIFGSPCSGKSTLAAGLFYRMKCHRLKVELITEYAKELVYDGVNLDRFDQLRILSEQNHRIERLINTEIEYVITDSPLLLSLIYGKYNDNSFKEIVKILFNQYNNINFLTTLNGEYEQYGRVHSESESKEIQKEIINMLNLNNQNFEIVNNRDNPEFLDKLIIKILSNNLN